MRVVFCNAPPDRAESIARTLVEQRVAACVNVIPGVVSVYRWKGSIEQTEESTLVIKTSDASLTALFDAIRKVHPYEVPEILEVDVGRVNPGYSKWVDDETKAP